MPGKNEMAKQIVIRTDKPIDRELIKDLRAKLNKEFDKGRRSKKDLTSLTKELWIQWLQ